MARLNQWIEIICSRVNDAIHSIRKRHHKRPDKEEISRCLHKKHDIRPETTNNIIDDMEEQGEIYAVEKNGKFSYFCAEFSNEDNLELETPTHESPELDSSANPKRFLDFEPGFTAQNDDSSEFTKWLMDLVNTQRRTFDEIMLSFTDERNRYNTLLVKCETLEEEIKQLRLTKKNESLAHPTIFTTEHDTDVDNMPADQKRVRPKPLLNQIPGDINKQLHDIRAQKHQEYIQPLKQTTSGSLTNASYQQIPNVPAVTPATPNISTHACTQLPSSSTVTPATPKASTHDKALPLSSTVKRPDGAWPKGTILITGDSIIGGIEEKRLTGKQLVKVRSFGGARIEDMLFYITPLLRKLPSVVIVHVGCNNSDTSNAQQIVDGLIDLKDYIEKQVQGVKVIFSTPSVRIDSNIAAKTLEQVTSILKNRSVEIIDNNNIDKSGLGRHGLHLNMKGTSRLAMNYINFLKTY